MRTLRSSLLEVLQSDYIDAARSRGLRELRVVGRHALRNALMNTLTILSVNVGFLIGGTLILEQVFQIPGVGSLLFDAVEKRDYQLVQTLALLAGRRGGVRQPARRRRAGVPRPARPARAADERDRGLRPRRRPARRPWRRAAGARRGLRSLSLQAKIGAAILAVLVLAAILAPLIAPYGQNELDFNNILSGPSLSHLFGTDSAGRDVFSRTLYALRIDLAIVVAVTYVPLPDRRAGRRRGRLLRRRRWTRSSPASPTR